MLVFTAGAPMNRATQQQQQQQVQYHAYSSSNPPPVTITGVAPWAMTNSNNSTTNSTATVQQPRATVGGAMATPHHAPVYTPPGEYSFLH